VNNVRTVSDTKRSFYTLHTRPINSLYRRVVEELMVEMHLLSVNADFQYDPVYALGVVTSFDRFMQGYQPEADRDSIFAALCQSIESNPQQFRQDADQVKADASNLTADTLKDVVTSDSAPEGLLRSTLQAIAHRPRFKYSRLFAIGLYALLEQIEAELVKDEKRFSASIDQLGESMHFSADKCKKDLELYRGNLEKMIQAQAVMADLLAAERKKKEQRAQERAQKEAIAASSGETGDESNG
jgi:photosystem II biogenesis protein Psp29